MTDFINNNISSDPRGTLAHRAHRPTTLGGGVDHG